MNNVQNRATEDGNRNRQEVYPAGKQDVELYVRTYTTMLRSSSDIKIKALVQAHVSSDSSLHVKADAPEPDLGAFGYSSQRLPVEMMRVTRVLLGQSEQIFRANGYDVSKWQSVSAAGRRRRWYYDGRNTLAVYIASTSDVDDIIPVLVGFQIEWNKLYTLLNADPNTIEIIRAGLDEDSPIYSEIVKVITSRLMMSVEDWERLRAIWGKDFWDNLLLMSAHDKSISVQMLGGTYIGYGKAADRWWQPIGHRLSELGLQDRPVYFVSSNTHSLTNMLGGGVQRSRGELDKFVRGSRDPEVIEEYENIMAGESKSNLDNFLYFISRRYYSKNRATLQHREQEESERGIHYIHTRDGMAVDAQIIELAKLRPGDLDPRLKLPNLGALSQSNAVLINIDYPLGLAAYYALVQLLQSVSDLHGVYVLGKAATLNGSIGDVMISNSVYDEHSLNTYWLDNCFTASDITPYLVYGALLDNQKAVTVKGPYLQNRGYLDEYYRESYTVVEMEAGPYLNALYEHIYSNRYPMSEHINLNRLPFDLGVLHYASDTPYTRGKNLGANSMAYMGMDSTYACSVAILSRIFKLEGAGNAANTEQNRQEAVASLLAETVDAMATTSRFDGDSSDGERADVDSRVPVPAGAGASSK